MPLPTSGEDDPLVASNPKPSRTLTIVGALVLTLGATLMVLHIGRYPPELSGFAARLGQAGFQGTKLLEIARVLGWLLLLNLAAWSLGFPLERMLRCPSPGKDLRPFYRLGFGFAVLSLLVLALAALHALRGPALHLTVLLPAVAIAIAWTRGWRALRERAPSFRIPWLGLAAGLLCLGAFLNAFGPQPGWDALTYHLALPERYLFTNGIVVSPFSHVTAFPFLMGMLTVPALVFGGPPLAALLHFEFGVLLLGVVCVAARRFSRLAAVLAPAILLADPLFQNELGWTYNDLTLAFYAFLAIMAFQEWSASSEPGVLRYAGVFCGISALVKMQGALVPAALLLMVWFPSKRRVGSNLRASLVLCGLALLTCSPWLARNFVFTGNPIAPLFQSLFYPPGGEYFDRTAIEQSTVFISRIGMGRGLGALLALPWNLVMRTVPETYSNSFGYQVTPLYVIGALGALLVAEVRRHAVMASLLQAGGLFTLFWFLEFQEVRFLIPALACFAAAGGAALAALAAGLPRWGRVFPVLALMGLLYCQSLFLRDLPARYGFALGTLSLEELRTRQPVEAAAAALRKVMASHDRLLLVGESRGFYFRGLDYVPYHLNEGAQVLQWIHRQPDLDALHCALSEYGVTHLLINVEHLRNFPPVFVPSYGVQDFQRDLDLVGSFADSRTRTVDTQDGIWVGALLDPPDCPGAAR